jgi:hypothetical protein
VLLDRVINDRYFSYLGNDLSFLEMLGKNENRHVKKIFGQIRQPDPAWTREVDEVQPWVQDVYKKLAKVFKLTVNQDTRHGGQIGESYADHYLTHTKWGQFCSTNSRKIDFEKCWAFETKGNWQRRAVNTAIVQCHRYSGLFFGESPENSNREKIYVSIMTDGRKFRLWYAYWDDGDMKGKMTEDYEWSQATLRVLGRVFKTFKKADLIGAGQDLGN